MGDSRERYWVVDHNADTTETGLQTSRTYIKTYWEGFPAQQSAELEIVETFCYRRFGDKVAYVQGIAPTSGWTLRDSNKDEFESSKPIFWGGVPTKTMRIRLGIGDLGKVRVISSEIAGAADDDLSNGESTKAASNVNVWRDVSDPPEFKSWVIAEIMWHDQGPVIEPAWYSKEKDTFYRPNLKQPLTGNFKVLRWCPLPESSV